MDATFIEPFQRLGVALALGLLIGMERGWQTRDLGEGRRVAGIRTFGLIGLLGGIAALLSARAGALVLATALIALAGLLGIALWRALRRNEDLGATTMVAALITFGLGALAGHGEMALAAASAVVVTLLLDVKPELHGLVRRLERREIAAVIQLLLISIVLLPVLPDRGFGPWEALNPYRLWWMVVLIAAISSLGYFAIKLAGTRLGLAMTALLGGLVASTAVTLNMARLAVSNPRAEPLLAAAVVLSAATMFPRMLLVVAVVGPGLLGQLALPLLAAGAAALAGGAWLWRRGGTALGAEAIRPRNPFELRAALKFGLLLGAIMILARALSAWAGEAGLYLLAAASGLGDVDAITLSYAAMAADGAVADKVAATGILIAAAVNTAVKPALILAVKGGRMALRAALPLAAALAIAAGLLFLLPDLASLAAV